jgi:DnaJ like chaperone protein
MFWLGKLLGAIFGYMIAGPFGAVFGLIFGHYFDLSRKGHWYLSPPYTRQQQQQQQPQGIFLRSTFMIMGYIAKSDGRVSENEIRAATQVMQNMMLTPNQRQQAINYFREGKQANFNLDETLGYLNKTCLHQRNLLNLFVDIQLQAAHADGILTPNKQKILEHICYRLGLNPGNFFQRSYRYKNAYNQYQYQQQPPPRQPTQLEEAYQTLGVQSSINNNELKKIYRKLISRHHPDKLISKGLSEQEIKRATERTQKIKLAYEAICKARGI